MSMKIRRRLIAAVVAVLLAGVAGGGAGAATPKGVSKCPHASGVGTTGDLEVVFGRRSLRANAVKLLRRVRRKGFRRAVIEREQCLFEVAVIGLRSRHAAVVIAIRAKKRGLAVSIMQS
jgi:hypothetical protein